MKKLFVSVLSLMLTVALAVPCFAVGMFDDLITAAGLGGLVTSAQAALVVVAAFPLSFAAYGLYKKVMGRGVGR